MSKPPVLCAVLLGAIQLAFSQGTLVFDQQSSDGNAFFEGGAQFIDHPVQSFTPTFTSVGFVTLYFQGVQALNAAITLRAESPTGPLLGTTLPVTTSTLFTGPVTFFFDSPVAVSPGAAYFFQSVAQVGTGSLNASPFYNYPGGTLVGGDYDLWFREGILIPEPTTAALALLAAALLFHRRRVRLPSPGAGPATPFSNSLIH